MLLSPVSVKCCCVGQEVECKIKRRMKPFLGSCRTHHALQREGNGFIYPWENRRILGNWLKLTGGERKRGCRGCQCQQRCPTNTYTRLCILMDHPWTEPEVLPTAPSQIGCINPLCLSCPLSKTTSSAIAFWIPLFSSLRLSPPQPHQTPSLSRSFCPTELNR